MPELFLVDPVNVDPVKPAAASLPDASERERALDIRASWIVEAPAGSGKTGLLIQRYLKLLADESVESPEQVLAITFTRKATAEMRERVLAQLQAAGSDGEPANDFERDTRPLAKAALARDRALNWQLLDQPARLNIRTIDSVCSDIANSLPLLSGTGGRRATVEDAMPLYLTAARRTFMQLGDPAHPALDRALRLILLHRDGNLPECERLLAGMLEHREQWGELVPLGRQNLDDDWLDASVLPRLERALEQAICSALTRLAKTIPASILAELTSAAAKMAHLEGYKGAISPIAICAGRHASPKETAEDLAHWRALIHLLVKKDFDWRKRYYKNDVGFEIGKSEGAQLLAMVQSLQHRDDLLAAICKLENLPPAHYPQEQWVVAKALFRILNRALAELQLVFAERSEADFAELALAARTALRHDDGARDLESASSIRLQHLLVDEMQDTSSSQYELIQMLTRNWDGHGQTVFLVGDPKQSIYLFRQARVERFLGTMRTRQLGDLPLGVLRLTANFRSQAALVNEFNDDFATVFPSELNTQNHAAVPFVKAFAIRPSSPESAGRVWHANILPNAERTEDLRNRKQRRRSDAARIRAIVEHWHAKPLPPGRPLRDGKPDSWKIAILVRSRNHLDEIVAEFKGNGADEPIPYRAVDIEPLETRPEVQDLFALTRALLHPADRIAWLAILRAPWCGLSLAELHTITGADDPAFADRTMMQLLAERGDLLEGPSLLRLERIWPVLEAAVAAIGRLPLGQTVERTWRSLGGDAYLTTSELTNVRRYLQLLDELEAQSTNFDLAALNRRLKKLFAAPVVHTGAVDLLTIHKAKGLEWDVVIVPALERIAANNRSRLLTWVELDAASQEDGAAHVLLAPIVGKGEPSADLNRWIASIHNSREAAERKRLFYVACTRAREELHLFASPGVSSGAQVQRRVGSLLESAWPAAEPHFAAALAASPPPMQREPAQDEPLAMAASVSAPERPALLQRLPISFDPTARFRISRPIHTNARDEDPVTPHFERPEGSVAARAFGNAVHAFLERITQQIATGTPAASILGSLTSWSPRVAAVLRAEGLQPAMVERLVQGVLHALDATLKDPHGLWLVSPQEGAATEFALTAWSAHRSSIRIDRIFRAGPEPLVPGSDHLWIVDYKTTTHGSEGLDAFLAAERARYAPQLEAYAAVLHQTDGERAIRLALYYPMLAELIWWKADGTL
jgi:ATP-dependent exoDNAse (exonuclease V) beta subunit